MIKHNAYMLIMNVQSPKFDEIVTLTLGDGSQRKGQVLEVAGKRAVVQVSYSKWSEFKGKN